MNISEKSSHIRTSSSEGVFSVEEQKGTRTEPPEVEREVSVLAHRVFKAPTSQLMQQFAACTTTAESTSSLPSPIPNSCHESSSVVVGEKNFVKDTEWRLSDFPKILEIFREGKFDEATLFLDQIADRAKRDPQMKSRTLSDRYQETEDVKNTEEGKMPWNATYDYNRIGHGERVGNKAVSLNWSDLQMPLHRYFTGGCPHTKEGVSVLFSHIIAEGGRVMVCLHQIGSETSDRIGEFWKAEILKDVPLMGGWSWLTEEFSSRVIEEGSQLDGKAAKRSKTSSHSKEPPRAIQIVENILVARRGEERAEIRLYHHSGWVDHSAIPDYRLFLRLMTLVLQMEVPPQTPIAVNCRGGVGRTGTFVGVHYLLLQMIDQLKKGVLLGEVRLNVSDMIYQLRVQRRIFLIGNKNLCDVINCICAVYEMIKNVGVQSFLTQKNLLAS